MSDELRDHLAVALREYRERKKLTQKDLAQLCGVTQTTISEIENGKANPTIDVLARISEALAVPPSALLGAGMMLGTIGGLLAAPILGGIVGSLVGRTEKKGFEDWAAAKLLEGITEALRKD